MLRVIEDLAALAWQDEAACRGMDPELFFPDRGTTKAEMAEALAACFSCPVRWECAAYGASERYGIWGGMTGRERRKWARERRRG